MQLEEGESGYLRSNEPGRIEKSMDHVRESRALPYLEVSYLAADDTPFVAIGHTPPNIPIRLVAIGAFYCGLETLLVMARYQM